MYTVANDLALGFDAPLLSFFQIFVFPHMLGLIRSSFWCDSTRYGNEVVPGKNRKKRNRIEFPKALELENAILFTRVIF